MSSVSCDFSICFCLGIAADRAHVVQAIGESLIRITRMSVDIATTILR